MCLQSELVLLISLLRATYCVVHNLHNLRNLRNMRRAAQKDSLTDFGAAIEASDNLVPPSQLRSKLWSHPEKNTPHRGTDETDSPVVFYDYLGRYINV